MRALLYYLFLFLFAASLQASVQTEKIKETILLYNDVLINTSREYKENENFEDLKNFEMFATKEMVRRLYLWIKSWQDSNQFMDAKLNSIKFKKISIKGDRAEVLSDEKWTYRYFGYISKNKTAEIDPPIDIFYSLKYFLVKTNNIWKIEKIEALSEKKSNPKK